MRIAGINIPDDKRVEIALTYIYGVGLNRAKKLLKETKISPDKRAKELDQAEVNKLKEAIDKQFKIEGELRQVIRQNIGMLKELGTYRGTRHSRNLPVRGQRTKTNSRTVRGNTRKTAGSGKRKVELK
ncbi:MAG: 30S ribosomal protein S13 [Candidatus Harrisonbacteria bacterium]|nr:30S ribosomal protein S13 [Candidatus Harrisonbacteria bacterium]